MTVSAAIKKLVNLKLMVRREDTEDTRAKLLNLTRKGKSFAKKWDAIR